ARIIIPLRLTPDPEGGPEAIAEPRQVPPKGKVNFGEKPELPGSPEIQESAEESPLDKSTKVEIVEDDPPKQNGGDAAFIADRPSIRYLKGVDKKFCQECGKSIRAKAVICPHCGCPQPQIKLSSTPQLEKTSRRKITVEEEPKPRSRRM